MELDGLHSSSSGNGSYPPATLHVIIGNQNFGCQELNKQQHLMFCYLNVVVSH